MTISSAGSHGTQLPMHPAPSHTHTAATQTRTSLHHAFAVTRVNRHALAQLLRMDSTRKTRTDGFMAQLAPVQRKELFHSIFKEADGDYGRRYGTPRALFDPTLAAFIALPQTARPTGRPRTRVLTRPEMDALMTARPTSGNKRLMRGALRGSRDNVGHVGHVGNAADPGDMGGVGEFGTSYGSTARIASALLSPVALSMQYLDERAGLGQRRHAIAGRTRNSPSV